MLIQVFDGWIMADISPDRVKSQLERILASSEFEDRIQLCQFLRYVVEQTLDGQSGNIKQYTVAVEALGYGADFDPQSNPTVRAHARQLRRALSQYYFTEGIEDPIRIDLPKGRYVPDFQLRTVTKQSSPETVREDTVQQFKPILAVIALSDLCQDESCRYIADGLTEEIVAVLTRFSPLPVMGPLHKERLKQENMGPRQIGTRYGVRFVLDGSVRDRKGYVRIVARLTDTTTGTNEWADMYEAQFDGADLFEIEKEISLKVLGAIADVHGVINKKLVREIQSKPPGSYSVHHAMLKFEHHSRRISAQSFTDAKSALENALETYPDSAQARAALGGMYIDGYTLFGGSKDLLDRALEMVESAYRLDSKDYMVQRLRAFVYFHTRTADEFKQAVELAVKTNPNLSAIGEFSIYCAFTGQFDRAVELFERARQINPHIPGYYYYTHFMAHLYRDEYEQALSAAQQIRMPAFLVDPIARAVALGYLGRKEEAGAVVAELLQLVPDFKESGRETIQRIFRYEQPVELLLEGLRKAGMEI